MGRAPVPRAVGLTLVWVALTLGAFYAARALIPAEDYRIGALAAIAVLSAVLAAWLTFTGGWRRAGFTPPADWRATGWLAVPAVLVLLPLATGIEMPERDLLIILVAGYALTGFAEEGFFRGVLLDAAAPLGPWRAVLLTSALFGLVHLSNILIRGNPAVTAAQAVGATCFGVGYAALRLRTGTVWPLVSLHFLTDLFLQLGRLPLIAVAVVQDVILLALGLLLIRQSTRANPVP